MEKTAQLAKAELREFSSSLQAIVGFITILVGLSAFIIKAFESKVNIALIFVGLFIVIHKICIKIINSKKESFGVISNRYSRDSVGIAKVVRVLNYILLLFPLYIGANALLGFKTKCSDQSNQLGVLISSFELSANDDFSYKLFTTVAADLQHADSISVIRVDKMVNIGGRDYLDSLKGIFESNCSNHGLYVFGRRSIQSNLFDCSVYINNIKIVNLDSNASSAKNVIYLANPDLINFSIENQSQIVSRFIVGLLQYHSGHYAVTREIMKRSIDSIADIDNVKFKSYCLLFLGNSFFKEHQYLDAIEAFHAGVQDDSTNAFMHYNLAASFLMNGDSLSAQREYIIANNLNSKLYNPLSDFRPTGENKVKRIITTSLPRGVIDDTTDSGIEDSEIRNTSDLNAEKKPEDTGPLYSIFHRFGKYGLYTPKGDTIIKCEYDKIYTNGIIYKGLRYFVVKSGSKYGAFDEKGVLAVPLNWPSIYYVEQHITATR